MFVCSSAKFRHSTYLFSIRESKIPNSQEKLEWLDKTVGQPPTAYFHKRFHVSAMKRGKLELRKARKAKNKIEKKGNRAREREREREMRLANQTLGMCVAGQREDREKKKNSERDLSLCRRFECQACKECRPSMKRSNAPVKKALTFRAFWSGRGKERKKQTSREEELFTRAAAR